MAAASSSSIISCLLSREDSVLWISSGWRWLRFNTCSDLNWEVSQVISRWEFQWPAQAVERDRVLATLNDFRGGHLSPPIVFGIEMSTSDALSHPAGPGAAWKQSSTQAEQFLLAVQICLHFITQFLAISFQQVQRSEASVTNIPHLPWSITAAWNTGKAAWSKRPPKHIQGDWDNFFNFSRFAFHKESVYLRSYYTAHWGTYSAHTYRYVLNVCQPRHDML